MRRWMTAHGVADIDLAYFGTADPRAHGIAFRKVFMVAENSQYWPEVTRARELIDQGAIGEVLTARACANSRLDGKSPFYAGLRPWRRSAALE